MTRVKRVERSPTIAIIAYPPLKLRVKDIPADCLWSEFDLQRAFAREVVQAQ